MPSTRHGATHHRCGLISKQLWTTFSAPVDTTLTGSVLHGGLDPTDGTWTCPATFPFQGDSMLQSKGYDPQPPPSGNWSLGWMNPL